MAKNNANIKWFYGVSTKKELFESYLNRVYDFEKCLSIDPVELLEIAREGQALCNKFGIEVPQHFLDVIADPTSLAEIALERGIDPQPSEITKINERFGTDYRNILELEYELSKSNVEDEANNKLDSMRIAIAAEFGISIVAEEEEDDKDNKDDNKENKNDDNEDDEDDDDEEIDQYVSNLKKKP